MLLCKMTVRASHASSKTERFTGKGLNLFFKVFAKPNQFQWFSVLLSNQRQSLHFSVASCSLLALLDRDCLLLCIHTAASIECHTILCTNMVALVSFHLQDSQQDTSLAALLVCNTYGWHSSRCIQVRHISDASCISQLLCHCGGLPQDL